MLKRSVPAHTWRFFTAGGFDQVKLENAGDLRALATLDQKLWVALACPTGGLEIDPRTLELIDTDKDGRVRAKELIAAVDFACANLRDPDALFAGAAELPLYDPYAENGFPWKRILIVAVILISGYKWYRGALDHYLPVSFRASTVFGWSSGEGPVKK